MKNTTEQELEALREAREQITYQGMTFDVIGDCHNAVDPHSKILFVRPTAGLSERVEPHKLGGDCRQPADSVGSTPAPASKYGYATCTIDKEALIAAGKDCDALQAIIEQRFINVNKALMESAQAKAFNDGTGQLEEEGSDDQPEA